jgi:uncharacterized phiE125 gp8 family phage protein
MIFVLQPPASLPLSRDEVKAFLDVRHGEFDSLLDEVNATATLFVEEALEVAVMRRRLELRLDRWPDGRVIDLPVSPLVAVVDVLYTSSYQRTLPTANYTASLATTGRGRIVIKSGQSWPSIDCEPDVVRVQYDVGYATNRAEVPADIALAIKETAHRVFDGRGNLDMPAIRSQIRSIAGASRPWFFGA